MRRSHEEKKAELLAQVEAQLDELLDWAQDTSAPRSPSQVLLQAIQRRAPPTPHRPHTLSRRQGEGAHTVAFCDATLCALRSVRGIE